MDWVPLTVSDERLAFLPIGDAKRVRERFWRSSIVHVSAEWRTRDGRPSFKSFSSEEDFYKWLLDEFV